MRIEDLFDKDDILDELLEIENYNPGKSYTYGDLCKYEGKYYVHQGHHITFMTFDHSIWEPIKGVAKYLKPTKCNCPNCGGIITNPLQENCDYCGIALRYVIHAAG